ncbi:hypothetical protein [Bradyrhizobium sp. 157]|nr:hypothetical protein [Bradyrhizobium sp. 157]
MTVQFERAGSIAVTVSIKKVGAMGPGNMGSMKQTPDHTMKK